jgi:hypothetical protein
MNSSMRAAILVVSWGLALAAAFAEPTIRRFDGKPVDIERIDREATRMMGQAKVNGLAMAAINTGMPWSWEGYVPYDHKPAAK